LRKSQVKLIWRHPYVVKTIKWRNLISKSPQVWLKKTLTNPKVGGTPGTFSRHQGWKSLIYGVYEGFRQTLLGYGGLVLGPSQFQVKKSVVHFKSDLKVIILLPLPRYFPPWFSQNPWYALCILAQFQQRSTYSFYACRSQKRKKIMTTWLSSYAFGICTHKSCT